MTWIGIGRARSLLPLLIGCAMSANPASGGNLPSALDFFALRNPRIRIEIAPANLDRLRASPRQDVPATVQVQDVIFSSVGIHLKGSGTFQPIDRKPSLTLHFAQSPAFPTPQPAKIHLNNSMEDGSYLREKLASEFFQAADVPAPRVTHASVQLNGRDLGVYVLKEGYTPMFVARYFERAEGNLYDTGLGRDVDQPMKHQWGRGANDQTDLKQLSAAAMEPDLQRRWALLQDRLDLDRFLTFLAGEMILGHWDGYALAQNNFRIYQDSATSRFVFLPAGLDQILVKADLPWRPEMEGMIARAVLEIPEGRRRYEERFRTLLASDFVASRLQDRVKLSMAELQPLLGKAFPKARREADDLCAQIEARAASLHQQLSEPGPRWLLFDHGQGRLLHWEAVDQPQGGRLQEVPDPALGNLLQITAGPKTSASWRSRQRLEPGRYRFRAQAKVAGVLPLPFGTNQGASLRVKGTESRSAGLLGSTAWTTLAVDFCVRTGREEVELVCELRARQGEARFVRDSLILSRLE